MPLPDFDIPGARPKAPAPGAGMPVNAVQKIQKVFLANAEKERMMRANAMFGFHAPLRMMMEREALVEHRRLPGLKSNFVGLSESMGLDDTIDFADIYGQQEDCPILHSGVADLHSMMEERLGMNRDITEVTNLDLTQDAHAMFSHAMAR